MHTPPPLDDLGLDLVGTTRARRYLSLLRPAAALVGVVTAVAAGHPAWALLPLFLVFTTVVSLMHDTVHGSLGLRRRGTDVTLFAAGALLMVSGHAYRATHINHHRVFPGPDDPEGEAARLSLGRAIAVGRARAADLDLGVPARAPRPRVARRGGTDASTRARRRHALHAGPRVRGARDRRRLAVSAADGAPAARASGQRAGVSGANGARPDRAAAPTRADVSPRAPSLSAGPEPQASGARAPARSVPPLSRCRPATRPLVARLRRGLRASAGSARA